MLKKGDISSVELTQAVLNHIDDTDAKIHSFVTVTKEVALKQAHSADKRIKVGKATPLTGIPTAIKDNMCTSGTHTTCSSRMLENFVPPYNATVVEKLKQQGMVMVGKTNLDEFAMGSSTENSAFGVTNNPWDYTRVPGGSSGGSTAAVAADQAIYALGSDTGGSIRQPAGFCSVVGLKPTYGRVSRFGLVAFGSSLDQIGPITKDVTDAALVLNTIAGHDPNDSTSINAPVPDYTKALTGDIKGLRIGIPREYFVDAMQKGVKTAIEAAIKKLEQLGAIVERDVSLSLTDYALATYYLIAPAEASANLARYDGTKYGHRTTDAATMWDAMEKTREEGFGPEVKRRIMIGTYALSAGYYNAYYKKAQSLRRLIWEEFNQAFSKYDALVTPTSPTVPFKIGEKTDDPMQMYLSDICTLPINIAGIPGLSVPSGFVDGLPVGLQILGRSFDEKTILRIGHAYEQATDWHTVKPLLKQ
ncbi:Asp-tRNA(Asn)/Glu-tRNA(Gln) amidotransferase subunit GatA [Chloroflexota bacterium]